jgi:hypothetical protein
MQSVPGADEDDDGFAAASYGHPPFVRSAVEVEHAASEHRMVALLSSSADHPSTAYGLETVPKKELLKSAVSLGGQAPHTPKVARSWALWAALLAQTRVVAGAVDWLSESVFAPYLFNADISLGLNTNAFVALDVHAVARLSQPIETTRRTPSPSITQSCFDAFVRDKIDDVVFMVTDDELRLPAVESAFQASFACDPVIARWGARADIAVAMAIGSWPNDMRRYSSATSNERHSPDNTIYGTTANVEVDEPNATDGQSRTPQNYEDLEDESLDAVPFNFYDELNVLDARSRAPQNNEDSPHAARSDARQRPFPAHWQDCDNCDRKSPPSNMCRYCTINLCSRCRRAGMLCACYYGITSTEGHPATRLAANAQGLEEEPPERDVWHDLSNCTTFTSTTVPEPRPEPPQDDPSDEQPDPEPLGPQAQAEEAERMRMTANDYDYYWRDVEDRARVARAKKRRTEDVRMYMGSSSSSGTSSSTTTTTSSSVSDPVVVPENALGPRLYVDIRAESGIGVAPPADVGPSPIAGNPTAQQEDGWKRIEKPEPPNSADGPTVVTKEGDLKAKARVVLLGLQYPEVTTRDEHGVQTLLSAVYSVPTAEDDEWPAAIALYTADGRIRGAPHADTGELVEQLVPRRFVFRVERLTPSNAKLVEQPTFKEALGRTLIQIQPMSSWAALETLSSMSLIASGAPRFVDVRDLAPIGVFRTALRKCSYAGLSDGYGCYEYRSAGFCCPDMESSSFHALPVACKLDILASAPLA